jgi:hypothetical protein
MLALAPKAPFIGYGGQFEGYEDKWKTANTTNWPYLEVNPDVTDGQGSVATTPAGTAANGLQRPLQAKAGALKTSRPQPANTTHLWAWGNERSGKAILARQREGDVGTYHYGDNLTRGVRHVARQLVDLIPRFTTLSALPASLVKMARQRWSRSTLTSPASQQDSQREGIVIEKIYNPGVGKYDVVATTGPGYATKRQEALEAMAQLLQGNPQLWAVAGDLFVKNMDWPGAQEMAKRFAKTIDPKFLSDEEASPELQAAQQQIQAMGQQMEQMAGMLDNVQEFRNCSHKRAQRV